MDEDTKTDPAPGAETDATKADADPGARTQADPPAGGESEKKDENRAGYEARQAKKRLDDLQKELEGYKRRDEEARKAKLTEEQKLKEERDAFAAENVRLKQGALQQRIAAEFKLPASLAARLIGSDEESLRADAEELAKLLPKPKAGSATDPVRDQQQRRIYKRSELQADPKLAASPEVRQAARENRISND
jgi:hypothetical protein